MSPRAFTKTLRSLALPAFSALLASFISQSARADPTTPALPHVSVSAACPSQQAVEAALIERNLDASVNAFVLTLHRNDVAAPVQVTLRDAEGNVRLERRIDSNECRAIAEATALIVESYFVELAAKTAKPARESAPNSETESASISTDSHPAPAAAPPTAAATPSASPPTSAPAPKPTQATTTIALATPPARTLPASGAALLPIVSLTTGIELLGTDPRAAWAGELSIGARLPQDRLRPRLTLGTASPSTLGETPNRVSRWASHASARLGYIAASANLEPWIGVGLSHTRVHALDLRAPVTQTSLSALFEAGVGFERPFTARSAWRFRADLHCAIIATREEYRIIPQGSVGFGPRFIGALLAGVSWSP